MRRLLLLIIIILLLVSVAPSALAVTNIEVNYPQIGPNGVILPGGGPAQWIVYIFYFTFIITGIAAVGSLIYAGIIWMTSGVSDKISDAKARIWSAILGIIIVAGSTLILQTINPDLITLSNPSIIRDFPAVDIDTFGSECSIDRDCVLGQYCFKNTVNGRNKCVFRTTGDGGVGTDCSTSSIICGGDLYCESSSNTCQKAILANQFCGNNKDACVEGLVCRVNPNDVAPTFRCLQPSP